MQPYRFSVVFALFLGASTALGADPPDTVAKSDPRTPLDERKAFHLPEGFDIELVASEPDIHKPMNIAFDDMGRLWVTETVEYPFPVGPGKVRRDSVKILSDFGPDGKARKIEAFADGLNIPIGLLPMPTDSQGKTSALVYSIPQILKINADGKTQEPLYSDLRHSRHPRDDQRLHLGLRRLDLRHATATPTRRPCKARIGSRSRCSRATHTG